LTIDNNANFMAGLQVGHPGYVSWPPYFQLGDIVCQSAWKTDPGSASKTDPFGAGVCSRPAA
jgi:hypothetical protein